VESVTVGEPIALSAITRWANEPWIVDVALIDATLRNAAPSPTATISIRPVMSPRLRVT
jgi:hypothetical protein